MLFLGKNINFCINFCVIPLFNHFVNIWFLKTKNILNLQLFSFNLGPSAAFWLNPFRNAARKQIKGCIIFYRICWFMRKTGHEPWHFWRHLFHFGKKMHDRISKVNIFVNNNNSKFNPGPHILATKA